MEFILIILMQALIATSRSISQDKFYQRERKRRFSEHKRKVNLINRSKMNAIIDYARSTQKIAHSHQKSKDISRIFRQHQTKIQRKKENQIILKKLWNIDSKIKMDCEVGHLQHISGSNWQFKKRQAETIRNENKRFGLVLASKKSETSEYKKKMENQIKQYLQLRHKTRKLKYNPKQKTQKSKLHRWASQKKMIHLQLNDSLSASKEVGKKNFKGKRNTEENL